MERKIRLYKFLLRINRIEIEDVPEEIREKLEDKGGKINVNTDASIS